VSIGIDASSVFDPPAPDEPPMPKAEPPSPLPVEPPAPVIAPRSTAAMNSHPLPAPTSHNAAHADQAVLCSIMCARLF